MPIKAPRLILNRHGVYYFRYKLDGIEKRISLRTKCSITANILALQLNLDIERKRAMNRPKLSDFDFGSIGRYELTLPNGVKIKTDGSQEDHSRALEALESIGPLLQNMPPPAAAPQPAAPAVPPSKPLTVSTSMALTELRRNNAASCVVSGVLSGRRCDTAKASSSFNLLAGRLLPFLLLTGKMKRSYRAEDLRRVSSNTTSKPIWPVDVN